MVFRILYFAFVAFLIAACNADNSSHNDNSREKIDKRNTENLSYYEFILEKRKRKDNVLISKGVIEQDSLATFTGLKYYQTDSTYIVNAQIEKIKPEPVTLETTSGKPRLVFKFLKLNFDLNGEKNTLFAFVENIDNPVDMFIPFKDRSNETETYKAGRYLDVKYQNETKLITLDFNLAYNPYCHYNHEYSCPLVPFENILNISIMAGEKKLYN